MAVALGFSSGKLVACHAAVLGAPLHAPSTQVRTGHVGTSRNKTERFSHWCVSRGNGAFSVGAVCYPSE
eukprot:4628070-Pyramimonas_sp.AAC.1